MDPEFQRALIVVSVVGTLVVAIAATVLFFAFRAFGGAKAGSSAHFGIIAALVAFVFACCAALLALSYAGG